MEGILDPDTDVFCRIVFSICYNSYNFLLQSNYFLQITFTSIPPGMYTISNIGINERIIKIF